MNFMDTEMEKNDELTSPQLLRRILLHSYYNFHRKKSGDFNGSLVGFKQALIRKPNRVKLLELSEKCLRENKQFDNLIFKDKCSVHKWEQPKLKGKPKHPVKVHVWAGISKRGDNRIDGVQRHHGRAALCLHDPQPGFSKKI